MILSAVRLKPARLLGLCLLLAAPAQSQTLSAPMGRLSGFTMPLAGTPSLGSPAGPGASASLSLPSPSLSPLWVPVPAPEPKLWLPGEPLRDSAPLFDGSAARPPLTTVEAAPEVRRSLERTMADVRGLYARFFPGLDPGLPVSLRFEAHERTDANLVRDDGHGTIRLRGPVPPGGASDRALGGSPFKAGPVMSGRIMRLVTVFHEYGHVIFYHRTGARPDDTRGFTAFDAVNEGFAVTLELLMIDKAVAAREELGLSEREAAELREWKRERLAMLRGRNHYTEGTLRVWHKLYRSGGQAALQSAADSLAPERLQGVPLDHPVFVLAGGEPSLLEAFTHGDERLWEGLRDLSNHVAAGKPITAAGLPAVQAILAKVKTSALRRYLRGMLGKREPAALHGPLRLAFLEDRAARELSDLVFQELARPDPMEAVRGPVWKDALRSMLPLIPRRPSGAGLIILQPS